MKRRRNLLVETLTALGPTGAMAGAELVKGRRRRFPVGPPMKALAPGRIPSFKAVREWDDRFGGPKLGVLEVSYERLAEAFGAPTPTKGGVDLEWWPEVTWYIAYDDGNTAMIYDWQLTEPVEKNTVWHVAGADPVLDYIASQLGLFADAVKDQRVEFRAAANPRQPNPTRKLARRLKR